MSNSQTAPAAGLATIARPIINLCFAALLAGLLSWAAPIGRAQPAGNDPDDGEVLTRGPVHEAFAGIVSYNPEPGMVVSAPPPDLIEEIPPEEKPEGDDVAWIPGYWGWDDERNDYLWISGTWRALPPGREWMAGYWRDTGDGHQWISGYWADANEEETTYLPEPPVTLEIGANIAAPSLDYGWTPGCWVWHQDRYAWRAGYWAQGRAEWVWVPAYYVWTPRGVIFVEGFWDYPVQRRGLLYAPVYYHSHGHHRRGYSYSPRIVINLSIFNDHLFLRPSYHHYYFGDYYDSRYDQDGFFFSFSFQSSRHGYDPFYSHNRWEHRQDREWDNRFQASYRYRRENEIARPPRTWAAQLTINTGIAAGGQTRLMIAAPIEVLAARADNPVRYQRIVQGDRQKLAQRGREVQQSRDQRRTVEAQAAVSSGRNTGESIKPAKVSAPRSPIVAKPAGKRAKKEMPPAVQRAPRPDPKVQPKAEKSGRKPDADRRDAPAETRKPEPAKQSQTERNAGAPRGKNAQPAATPRPNPAAERNREEPQRKEPESPAKAQRDDEKRARDANAQSQAAEKTRQQSEERVRDATEKAQKDLQRKEQQSQMRAQQDAERRNKDAATKAETAEKSQRQAQERGNEARAQEDSQRKAQQAQAREQEQQRANESAARAQQAADDRAKAGAANAQKESRQNAPKVQNNAPPEPDRRTKESEAAAKEKPTRKEKQAGDEEEETKKEKHRGR